MASCSRFLQPSRPTTRIRASSFARNSAMSGGVRMAARWSLHEGLARRMRSHGAVQSLDQPRRSVRYGAGSFTYHVLCRRYEEQQVGRSTPLHAHDDQVALVFWVGALSDRPLRSASVGADSGRWIGCPGSSSPQPRLYKIGRPTAESGERQRSGRAVTICDMRLGFRRSTRTVALAALSRP